MLNDGHNIKSFIYCSIFSLHEMILSTFILEGKKLTLIMLRNLPKFIQQVVESKCGSQVV